MKIVQVKSFLTLIVLLVVAAACKEKFSVESYYKTPERDSLMVDIITYIYQRPPEATPQDRFDSKFRSYYVKQLPKFQFQHYFVSDAGVHYYYIIRPARSPIGNTRGVGGTFQLDAQKKIIQFREVFNTPVASGDVLQTRGLELFKYMIKTGGVNDYEKNPDYIEWPNKLTYYDTLQHEWLSKPGL